MPDKDEKKLPEEVYGFLFFDKGVLAYYRMKNHLYEVKESDFGGHLSIRDDLDEKPGKVTVEYLNVQFGYRKLKGGGECVGPVPQDWMKMPAADKARWRPHFLKNPPVVARSKDGRWLSWVKRFLLGEDEVANDPLDDIKRELELLRALAQEALGGPIWKKPWNPMISRPAAENGTAYADAHRHVFALLVDEIDKKKVELLAQKLNVKLTDSRQTMNSMKEILASGGQEALWTPIRDCTDARNVVHGVGDHRFDQFPASKTFERDVKKIARTMRSIRRWLEKTLLLSAENCEARIMVLERMIGRIVAPARPEGKIHILKQAEGKKILRIECGVVEEQAKFLQNEALVIHFTDGTALGILADAATDPRPQTWKKLKRLSGYFSPEFAPATKKK